MSPNLDMLNRTYGHFSKIRHLFITVNPISKVRLESKGTLA